MWLYSPLPRSLAAALRDLEHESASVRVSALGDLARYFEADERSKLAPALLRALTDASPQVRALAAHSLGELREPTAAARLLVTLEDEDAYVRQMAIQALGTLGNPCAVPRLRRALTDDRPEVRFQTLLALPKLVPEEAVALWIDGAHDADAHVRYIALRSLEEHFDRGACSELPEPVRDVVRAALLDDDVAVRCAAALLLAHQRDRAGVGVLLQIVNGTLQPPEPEDEIAAVERVADLGVTDAIPALETRAFGPARYFRETFPLVARVSLARLGHAQARAALLRDLHAWSRSRRTLAVVAVGRARLREARRVLLAMKDRPERADPDAVMTALHALD